jgi:hypothetical protein
MESFMYIGKMDFSLALNHLRAGARIAREGWNGKNMWLTFIDSGDYNVTKPAALGLFKCPWIGMKTADGKFVPWLASQTDILAEDWTTVPPKESEA